MTDRSYTSIIEQLRQANLRPTRQRIGLGRLLFSGVEHRHVTADQLHLEAENAGLSVSLATVYNTLHQFCEAGLLREVVVDPGRSYFDTNTGSHHHFFNTERGELMDIPVEQITVTSLPNPPSGTHIDRVDIVVRVCND
jgi:Fur family transcriptional regulator, iron response regulator